MSQEVLTFLKEFIGFQMIQIHWFSKTYLWALQTLIRGSSLPELIKDLTHYVFDKKKNVLLGIS